MAASGSSNATTVDSSSVDKSSNDGSNGGGGNVEEYEYNSPSLLPLQEKCSLLMQLRMKIMVLELLV